VCTKFCCGSARELHSHYYYRLLIDDFHIGFYGICIYRVLQLHGYDFSTYRF
jgi:hypothetical protein